MQSILHVTHRDEKYTTINLTAVEDKNLSGLAKALHLYAMSRPPGWILRTTDILNRFKEGQKAIWKALYLLEEFGYLTRKDMPDPKTKKFVGVVYDWYEEPLPLGKRTHLRRYRTLANAG